MTMLGYDPARYHTGRAPIEAASQGIEMAPDDVVFRMNLVSLKPGDGGALVMDDFTSGHITSEEAGARSSPICARELAGDGIEFFNGVSYRHLMVWRGGPAATHLTPPHDITGKPVEDRICRRARALIDCARSWIARRRFCASIRSTARGSRAGKPAATSVWFWGQGRRPAVPTLKERFGVEGSVISAVDLVNGFGQARGPRADHGARRDRLPRYRLCGEGALWAQVAGAP